MPLPLIYTGKKTNIYLKDDENSDSYPIVIKTLRNSFPNQKEIEVLDRELKFTQELHVPGIRKAIKKTRLEHKVALQLEFVQGVTLTEYFDNTDFHLEEFLNCFLNTIQIVEKIHQAGIIHHNLTPDHILINRKSKAIHIIGFGISTSEEQLKTVQDFPEYIQGEITHISPEKTGRTNGKIDFRSDLYSLGVTFYRLATGELPFANNGDKNELIHKHLSQEPLAPHILNQDLPKVISDIIQKLLAKDAEDRYQSARGLSNDLLRLKEILKGNNNTPFEIGNKEHESEFTISSRMYGRELQLEAIQKAYDQLINGKKQLLLIKGKAGMGKSTLVEQFRNQIPEHRNFFKGKFEQVQNSPYSAISESFNQFCQRLLTKDIGELEDWGIQLQKKIEANGRVLTDLIPNLENILGKQPKIKKIEPIEVENRFNFVWEQFIDFVANKKYPLILFYDDLHWANPASLKLINHLMLADNLNHLLIIGTYREEDISENHPLQETLKLKEKIPEALSEIELSPLNIENIQDLICNSLSCSKKDGSQLASHIHQKTLGNAFFIKQFLQMMFDDGFLNYDAKKNNWIWDRSKVSEIGYTENVADLMTGRLNILSSQCFNLLKHASCIGSKFGLKVLSEISNTSFRENEYLLTEAIGQQLISRSKVSDKKQDNPKYIFLHDRIQQAAYDSLNKDQKALNHLNIGRLIWHKTQATEEDIEKDQFIYYVNHYNLGFQLVQDKEEKIQLAFLNLKASRVMKDSAAYDQAKKLLEIGLQLLDKTDWSENNHLCFNLHLQAAEIAYLQANYQVAGDLTGTIIQNSDYLFDKIEAYEIQILSFINQGYHKEAIKLSFSVLKLLEVHIPQTPNQRHVIKELLRNKILLLNKTTEDLYHLPKMEDLKKKKAMRILNIIIASAYWIDIKLYSLIVLKMIRLSILYGNASNSLIAYANYAILESSILGNFKKSYEFGTLALKLLDRNNSIRFESKIYMTVKNFISPLKEPFQNTLSYLWDGYTAGMQNGEIEWAIFNLNAYFSRCYNLGHNLDELEKEIDNSLKSIQNHRHVDSNAILNLYRQAILSLQGKNECSFRLDSADWSEKEHIENFKHKNFENGLFYLYHNKLFLSFIFEEYNEAWENAKKVKKHINGGFGNPHVLDFYFLLSLTKLQRFDQLGNSKKIGWMNKILRYQRKLYKHVKHAPFNYEHKYWLVEAEIARVKGHSLKAIQHYETAAKMAKSNGVPHIEAMINELCARHWLDIGQDQIAHIYIKNAKDLYDNWGATAKVEQLQKKYSDILGHGTSNELENDENHSNNLVSLNTEMDINSITKASHTLSGEIVLNDLIRTMMQIVIENAGAEKGILIRNENDHLSVWARGMANKFIRIEDQSSIKKDTLIPNSIVYFVYRTRKPLIVSDATSHEHFKRDSYIRDNQVKSVLCYPIIRDKKVLIIFYLENNLSTNAFTPALLEVLKLLSTQIAISLDNAILYEKMEEKVRQRTSEIELKSKELKDINERLLELNDFKQKMTNMIAHDLKNPLNTIMGLTENNQGDKSLKKIYNASQRMYYLILDMLDTHKLEEASMQLQLENTLLEDSVKSVLNQMEWFAHSRNTQLSFSSIKGIRATIDKKLIGRVLMNLIRNAILHNPNEKEVSIKTDIQDDSYIKITVSDNGECIPESEHVRIFEKYHQLKMQENQKNHSSGLGLTFCKMVIEAHKGEIGVYTGEEKGNHFWFKLPITDALPKKIETYRTTYIQSDISFTFHKDEISYLKEWVEKLIVIEVNEFSAIKSILNKIETNQSPAMNLWKSELEETVYTCDNKKYRALLNLVLNTENMQKGEV
jgi:predicted ATPase/signal transduction histidine kinase